MTLEHKLHRKYVAASGKGTQSLKRSQTKTAGSFVLKISEDINHIDVHVYQIVSKSVIAKCPINCFIFEGANRRRNAIFGTLSIKSGFLESL